MQRTRGHVAVVAVLAVVVLGGCDSADADGDGASAASGEDTASGAVPPDLAGAWTLRSGTGPGGEVDLRDGDVEVTLAIDAGRWGGTVCNTYGSSELEVGDGTVRVGDVVRTEMACLDPGVMEAEDAYLAAFGEVDTWAVSDDRLTLAAGDEVELVYDRVLEAPDADVVGTGWVLEALVSGTGPEASVATVVAEAPTPATLELDADGRFTASDGCDTTGGSYDLDDGRLELTPQGWTEQACAGVEQQADHVRAVLEAGTVEVAVDGARLTLTADDRALVYRADTTP